MNLILSLQNGRGKILSQLKAFTRDEHDGTEDSEAEIELSEVEDITYYNEEESFMVE